MSVRPPWMAAATAIEIRRADLGDRPGLAAFLREMDGEGLYQRHFAHGEAPNLALLGRLDMIDGRNRVMLLALDANAKLVGHAEYVAVASGAEFALMVLRNWRDCGIGSALLDALEKTAAEAGLEQLHGLIQATNTRALQLVGKRGFHPAAGDDPRTVIVSRRLTPGDAADRIDPACAGQPLALPPNLHDPDRVPLHRRPGP